jgi:hypothetical protein
MIYFGYMALVSLAFFLVAGYIGITASLWFNRMLYEGFRKKSDSVEENEMIVLQNNSQEGHYRTSYWMTWSAPRLQHG